MDVGFISLYLWLSRLMELEADSLGLELAARACLDVHNSTSFYARLEQQAVLQAAFQTTTVSGAAEHPPSAGDAYDQPDRVG